LLIDIVKLLHGMLPRANPDPLIEKL